MTKIEFLDKLDLLLSDLPDEERMNAVWYYEDYFAEAGEVNEEAVLAELGSPEIVAQGIRSACFDKQPQDSTDDYDSSFADAERRAYEEGQRAREAAEAEQYREQAESTEQGHYETGNAQYSYREVNQNDYRDAGYRQGYAGAGDYHNRQNGEPGRPGTGSNVPLLVIIVLICFLGLPVILPIAFTIIALAGGLFLGFGIGGVALMIAGVALGGVAVTGLSVNAGLGMLLLGVALVIAAIGLLLSAIAVCCGFRVIPSVIRGIVDLIRRLLGKGGTRREKIY